MLLESKGDCGDSEAEGPAGTRAQGLAGRGESQFIVSAVGALENVTKRRPWSCLDFRK